ncbi:MAG: hypothetical protein HY873_05335 [Chloroflexi bacterium]|nr:hypothetical protein [Chloroflexota bacterium]
MRIIKGEVKQVLTEIRSAILTQDSPFEDQSSRPRAVQIVPAVVEEPARVEIIMPRREEPPPAAHPTAQPHAAPLPQSAAPHNAAPHDIHEVERHLEPEQQVASPQHTRPTRPQPPQHAARWSLLTVANLAAWSEDAIRRIGPQRLAILLDLCEVSGYLAPDARQALARVSELDIDAPEQPASPMEVTVLLRQLDALLQGEHSDLGPRLIY